MPEIWLKYGSTEVVLDIKAENLSDYVVEDEQLLSEEEANGRLDSVSVDGNERIAVLDTSLHVAKLSLRLADSLKRRGVQNISVNVPLDVLNIYKNIFQDKNVEVSKLSMDLSGMNNTILLSKTSFDPLFGYSGAPTHLLRSFGGEEMLDAYKGRNGDMPRPGEANNSLSVAHKFVQGLDTISVEAVVGGHGFADIIVDKPVKCHKEAITKLESLGKVEVEKAKASIISSGNGYSTLSYALYSIWNCLDVVKEDGYIALLAECKDGFGSRALQMLVDGKISMDDAYRSTEYIDGIENLLYLKAVSERYNLSLVSALPDYYIKNNLGIKTFRRTKDVLHSMLNVYGPRQKVLVVSDGSKVLLKHKVAN
ncbi:MAG: hypothetical protein ACE5KA_01555 [Nitrososphaerales archaeon]